MGDVVNLRMARKRAARTRDEHQAAEKRALHGRTRAEKERDRLSAERAASALDRHRRDKPGGDGA